MFVRRLIVLFLMVLMFACGKSEEQKKKEADLHAEIMRLHDDIMIQQKQLKELGSYLSARVNTYTDYPKRDSMLMAIDLCDSAQMAMRLWMRNYRKYDPNKPHEEVMNLLNADKEKLLKIKSDTEKAMDLCQAAYHNHDQFIQQKKQVVIKK